MATARQIIDAIDAAIHARLTNGAVRRRPTCAVVDNLG